MADRNISSIARETLKQLALRRLAPTPDNYQSIFAEVAGLPAETVGFPEQQLRAILRVLPAQTPQQIRLIEQLGAAINRKEWSALQNVMIGYANLGLQAVATAVPAPASEPAHILPDDLSEQLARVLDSVVACLSEDDVRIHDMAVQIINLLREGHVPASTLVLLLNNFTYRLSFSAEDQATVRLTLLLGRTHGLPWAEGLDGEDLPKGSASRWVGRSDDGLLVLAP